MEININEESFVVNDTAIIPKVESFWELVNAGKWEPQTFNILDKFLDEDHTYIDIGTWIGPTILYGSRKSKFCYALEPDHIAYAEAIANIRLNDIRNINLYHKGLYDIESRMEMKNRKRCGDGMAKVITDGSKGWLANFTTFDKFVESNNIQDCSLIKMDIEGAEEVVLPTMADYIQKTQVPLFVSIHYHLVKDPSKLKQIIKDIAKLYIKPTTVDEISEYRSEILFGGDESA